MMSGKIIYKKDLSLPRFTKTEFSEILVNKEFYKTEIEDRQLNVDSYEEFFNIWCLIADKVKEQVATNPLGVHLPFFMGDLKVNYLPYKIPLVNDILSQEVGVAVPQLFLNSKGKRASIVWERKEARRFNRMLNLYAFEPMQATFRNRVKEVLRTNPNLYRTGKLKDSNTIRP